MTAAIENSTIRDIVSRVPRLERLCPQQIVSDDSEPPESHDAALVDQFGRAHWLWPVTVIGRELDESDVAVLESSVSRRHAELRHDAAAERWVIGDLGSTNGTFVEGRRITEPVGLSEGDRLTIGEVGFAFVTRRAGLFEQSVTESFKRTARALRSSGPVLILLGPAPGGGGIVEHSGTYVQLGPTQYALVEILAQRWSDDDGKAEPLRGFVRSIDLIADLPWETPYPEDNNVKQLVRRVRRAFKRAGLGNPVESRHGFGYRLSGPARIQSR